MKPMERIGKTIRHLPMFQVSLKNPMMCNKRVKKNNSADQHSAPGSIPSISRWLVQDREILNTQISQIRERKNNNNRSIVRWSSLPRFHAWTWRSSPDQWIFPVLIIFTKFLLSPLDVEFLRHLPLVSHLWIYTGISTPRFWKSLVYCSTTTKLPELVRPPSYDTHI